MELMATASCSRFTHVPRGREIQHICFWQLNWAPDLKNADSLLDWVEIPKAQNEKLVIHTFEIFRKIWIRGDSLTYFPYRFFTWDVWNTGYSHSCNPCKTRNKTAPEEACQSQWASLTRCRSILRQFSCYFKARRWKRQWTKSWGERGTWIVKGKKTHERVGSIQTLSSLEQCITVLDRLSS